jgi:hypothetical protein
MQGVHPIAKAIPRGTAPAGPTGRDTCFVNIVRRHRPSCLTSGSQQGSISHHGISLRVPVQPNGARGKPLVRGNDRNKCTLRPDRRKIHQPPWQVSGFRTSQTGSEGTLVRATIGISAPFTVGRRSRAAHTHLLGNPSFGWKEERPSSRFPPDTLSATLVGYHFPHGTPRWLGRRPGRLFHSRAHCRRRHRDSRPFPERRIRHAGYVDDGRGWVRRVDCLHSSRRGLVASSPSAKGCRTEGAVTRRGSCSRRSVARHRRRHRRRGRDVRRRVIVRAQRRFSVSKPPAVRNPLYSRGDAARSSDRDSGTGVARVRPAVCRDRSGCGGLSTYTREAETWLRRWFRRRSLGTWSDRGPLGTLVPGCIGSPCVHAAPAPALRYLEKRWKEAVAHARARESGGSVRLALDIEDSGLDYLNYELALRSLDLLEHLPADRTRVCSGSACGWVFIDRSKGGRRRWCDMATCGNAEKSRRHYQRTKASRPSRR